MVGIGILGFISEKLIFISIFYLKCVCQNRLATYSKNNASIIYIYVLHICKTSLRRGGTFFSIMQIEMLYCNCCMISSCLWVNIFISPLRKRGGYTFLPFLSLCVGLSVTNLCHVFLINYLSQMLETWTITLFRYTI